MVKQGLSCDGWSWGIERYCRNDANWNARKTCQQACHDAGRGYDGDGCGPPPPPPSTPPPHPPPACTDEPTAWMAQRNITCAEWDWGIGQYCNRNEMWTERRNCQQSCYAAGAGYAGDTCGDVPLPPTPPPPICTDNPTPWMAARNLSCKAFTYGLRTNCGDPSWREGEICNGS